MRNLIIGFGVCMAFQAHAIPCFITFVKDSCWTNYNVMLNVTDAATKKTLQTVSVAKGKTWERQQFECQPREVLLFSATFTPVFWENTEGKSYTAKREWALPTTVSPNDKAWHITLCFPAEFSEVPLPPEANGRCQCLADDIPPVSPQ